MLRLYVDLEPRLRILGLALKTLQKLFKIHKATNGGISSYALCLMLVHYLQQRGLLPVLQKVN